jgi:toxin CcdB
MARFDVYAITSGVGFLLDVQADLLAGLNTRVVVPLLPSESAPQPARRLNPVFQVQGHEVVMLSQFIAAIPMAELKEKVGSLETQRDEVLAALDFLFQGW